MGGNFTKQEEKNLRNVILIVLVVSTVLSVASLIITKSLLDDFQKQNKKNENELTKLNITIETIKQEREAEQLSVISNAPESCLQIQNQSGDNSLKNGIYYIKDNNNLKYPVYCDMNVDGGGWTLVATVHENNIRPSGRCSVGDKWSSEAGNEPKSQAGGEAWFNHETFGNVISATSQDYKNAAYFDLQARDIMIWQVPNDTPPRQYYNGSYLRYFTLNGFLRRYGGNMFHLYRDFYPMKSGVYNVITDSGPAIPVTFDKGSAAEVRRRLGTNVHRLVDPGFIQFRVVNNHKSVYALCPGTKGRSNYGDLEHSCIGSTADNLDVNYCGDFSSLLYDLSKAHGGWSADFQTLNSTFMIFYR